MLAASLAIAVVPAFAQNMKSDFDTQSSPYTGKVVEEIVARVNDRVISLTDYKRAEKQLQEEAQQRSWTEQRVYEKQKNLLRDLIDNQLLLSKGKQLGITGGTRLIERLDEIRKQYHLASMEALQKDVESEGIAWEDFKQHIRDGIIREAVLSQEVGAHINIAPSEIQAYYDQHKSEFERPEAVSLSEILIPTANPDNAAQVAKAKAKADEIETQLRNGTDFATLAKTDSGGPTAQQGGVLGQYSRGQLPKVMEDATFSLKPGGVTQPILTKQGWLILEVTKHQNAGLAPLDEVQNQIQEDIGMAKMGPVVREYLTKLRTQAYIDIRPGYVDSGATPNEMKFIQSAYVPPSKHKKKKGHRERVRFQGRTRHRRKKVNEREVARNRSQRPGKKEKIRFGQAPREALPPGPTTMVNAGAGPNNAPQESENQAGLAPGAGTKAEQASTPSHPRKWRLTDELKVGRKKRRAEAEAEKHHNFVAPKLSAKEKAKEAREDRALGLNGNTSDVKKVNSARKGPKRRFSNQGRKWAKKERAKRAKKELEKKDQQQEQQTTSASGSGTN
jgi:peptidyl-prolyl cis-trans isomerase SurA